MNHKNEQRDDNRAENLEWVTAKENINHGRHNERMAETKGQRVVQYTMDGEKVAEFRSLTEASVQTGIMRENIGKCCNHADGYLSAGGFRWEFFGTGIPPTMMSSSSMTDTLCPFLTLLSLANMHLNG